MKRANVYTDKTEKFGKVLIVENKIEDFIKEIAAHFNRLEADIKLFSGNGCEILDIRVIRDDEKIYLSLEGSSTKTASDSLALSMRNLKVSEADGIAACNPNWVSLNIGGKIFTTSKNTLLIKEPQSMLARMFSEDNFSMNPSVTDSNGAFLIDRSPEYFEPILNYLRHGTVILDSNVNPKGVLAEATFYGIESMIPILQTMVEKMEDNSSNASCHKPLTRSEVVKSIIITPISAELRFQGVNLAGADLNRLDLRHINFKHACLAGCNLSGANLSNCCLERADLSHANLEGAQLWGVKALCANMEGANLKNCNMEDPLGTRAILEGVNLKGANLEGSNMASVNLRVATLKFANLQNCVLRAAVLAGANLEVDILY